MLEQGALWIFLSNFQHTALRALGNNAGESLNHFSRPLSPISSLVCFPKGSNLLPFPAESPSLSVFNWISAKISIYAWSQLHDKDNISCFEGASGIGELNT